MYGSDALAGVVNFIMRKDFRRRRGRRHGEHRTGDNDNSVQRARTRTRPVIRLCRRRGVWDGETDDATLLMGTNTANGKGNVTRLSRLSSTTQPVLESTRDLLGVYARLDQRAGCAGSIELHTGSLSIDNSTVISLDDYAWRRGLRLLRRPGTGQAGSGRFRTDTRARPTRTSTTVRCNYLQRPDTRYTGGFFAHYQENKQLDIYSSFMFADDHTVAQIAPSGLFLGSGDGQRHSPGNQLRQSADDAAGTKLCFAARTVTAHPI